MKKIIAVLLLGLSLGGCVVAPVGYEPEVVVGAYPIGYYNPGYGYWTGVGWDINFYAYGHRGYGHRYYGGRGGHYHGGRH